MHETRSIEVHPATLPPTSLAAAGEGLQLHASMATVPADAWDALAGDDALLFSRRYLGAMEAGTGPELESRYALFTDRSRPQGLASFHLTEFVGQPLDGLLGRAPAGVELLARTLGLAGATLRRRLLVCGNALTGGAHGFVFRPEVAPAEAARRLVAAMDALREQLPEPPAAMLVKDFGPDDGAVAARLVDHGFFRLATEPGMVLELDPRWTDLHGYLDSLTAHYRGKARRALVRSAGLKVRDLAAPDLPSLRPAMAALQDAVLARAGHRLGRLGLDAYPALQRALGEELVLRGFFLGDQLVGYTSGLVVGDTLLAQCVGLDYSVSRDLGLYQRMLLDYLDVALARRLARVDYGRTATEIKSTLGAAPVPLHCYVRHVDPTVNRLLGRIAGWIDLPAQAVHRPFKEERGAAAT